MNRAEITLLERRLLFDASAFDPSFGVGGKGRYDIAGLSEHFDAVYALPDGKILAAGEATFGMTVNLPTNLNTGPDRSWTRDTRGVLVRLNADGTLDQSFGTGGVANYQSDPYAYAYPDDKPDQIRIDQVFSIALQGDGKVLVGGRAFAYHAPAKFPGFHPTIIGPDGNEQPAPFVSDWAFAVARYNADGTVDTSFGRGGMALTDMLDMTVGGGESVTALAVQADGRVVVAGWVEWGGQMDNGRDDSDIGVTRLNPDGSLDETFGKQLVDFPRFDADHRRTEGVTDVAIQPDGKILLGGSSGGWNGSDSVGAFALARLNPDGTRDTSFGNGGFVLTSFPPAPDPLDLRGRRGGGALQDMALLDDGRILAVGSLASANLCMARYNPDGSLDASFGDGGRVVRASITNANYRAAVAADGTISVAGVGNGAFYERNAGPSGMDVIGHDTGLEVFAARFDPAGRLLEARRAVGQPLVGSEFSQAMAVQADGKILSAGSGNPIVVDNRSANDAEAQAADAAVARFDPSLLSPFEAPGVAEAPSQWLSGQPIVRRGRWLKFRIAFADETAARQAAVTVTGPGGAPATVQFLKVKPGRRGRPAVATYRVLAPGGTFDAGDNGGYGVRLGNDAEVVGTFIVDSRVRRPQESSSLVRLFV